MAKFNLKEHIAKNKATFFGSLTEGQFSWMTQDTGQQIGSQDENMIPVYMFDDKGKYYYENDYEGYGVFGGKDYYDLVAEMNGYTADDAEELGGTFGELRGIGIKLAFGELEPKNGGPVLFPALVTKPDRFNYKTHDFTQEAETDPNQSWYTPEEDDYYDQNDDDEDYNRYGDEDEDEELEEGKVEEAYNSYTFKVAKNFAKYMSKKEGKDFEVTMNSVDEYSFDLDLDGEPYAGGSYLIQNGNIHNVAVPGNPIYATTDDMLDYVGEGYMGQFYAPEYLEKKYGKEMAKKIEAEIDEMDENSWDRFTGMESAEEVDEYVADIVSMLKEGYDEFKRVEKGKKKTVAKDKGEEEVYGAGVKKGEEIEKKKMKVSELKAKIKEMVLAEMNLDVTDETSGYDFLAELEEMMDEEEFSVKLLVPTVYYNPKTGELAETPAAFGADSELEDMGITNYSDGDELSEWVFDNDIEKAKYFEKEYPGLFKVEGMMSEAKEEEVEDEVDVDIESPEAIDEPTSGINVTQNADADLTGTEKELQDNLEAALEAAKKIGDDKLQQQIGNSLTFFTRQHVVKENLNEVKFKIGDMLQTYGGEEKVKVLDIKPNLAAALADNKNQDAVEELEKDLRQGLIDREDRNKPFYLVTSKSFPINKYYVESELESLINESMFPNVKENIKETLLLQKRAGIITEAQYKEKLNEASEDEVPLTSKVKSFINKAIADSKKDEEFENLKKADWFENELIDELIDLFPNKDYDSASKEVMDYIKDKIK